MITISKIYLILIISLYPSLLKSQLIEDAKVENVMAVYLYNFTKFLEWPESESDKFHIYILGKNSLFEPLEVIAEKQKIFDKYIVVEEINEIKNLTPGSILFIDSKFQKSIKNIVELSSQNHILTVGSFDKAVEQGICINFVIIDDKLKFEINRTAIENAGIKVNSKLLTIAARVIN